MLSQKEAIKQSELKQDKLREALNEYTQIFDNLPVNVMIANKDRIITKINPAGVQTLKSIQHLLPMPAEQIQGSSYDKFHANPKRQAALLSDPKNLPFSTQIKVGKETLDLLMTPLFDLEKNFMGPMVTWSVISEKVALQEQNLNAKDRLRNTVLDLVGHSSSASDELTKYITCVVAAMEEMLSSIQEISSSTNKAADMTHKTVRETATTEEIINQLEIFSREIGAIIQVVNNISQQTDLLALNATIEAARAGEAGRGFAVVAGEVKELAKQTSNATDDIQVKIGTIQNQIKAALDSINTTSNSVQSINSVVVSIASAIEEQTAVSNEIGRNMNLANEQVLTVNRSIEEIHESVESNIAMMG